MTEDVPPRVPDPFTRGDMPWAVGEPWGIASTGSWGVFDDGTEGLIIGGSESLTISEGYGGQHATFDGRRWRTRYQCCLRHGEHRRLVYRLLLRLFHS